MATAQMTTAMRTPTLIAERAEPDRARYLESHEHGWERHLGELLDHVASKASAARR